MADELPISRPPLKWNNIVYEFEHFQDSHEWYKFES